MKRYLKKILKLIKENRKKVESCCFCLLLIAAYFVAYFGAERIKEQIEPSLQSASASNDEMPVIILDAGHGEST